MNRRWGVWRAMVLAVFFIAACAHGNVNKDRTVSTAAVGTSVSDNTNNSADSADPLEAPWYSLPRPGMRAEHRALYFQKEYESIESRRKANEFEHASAPGRRPADMVGLALSGGGMRANAFHLGILSGLHDTAMPKPTDKNLLDRVDYLSSVSGGTWAAAAYLFNDDACNGTSIFRRCSNCGPINDRVPHFLVNRQGEMHRENWRKEIGHDFAAGANHRYDELPGIADLDRKPYFIINVTHSAMFRETGSERNFNFQFTRDALGTVVDCRSQTDQPFCGAARKFRWWALNHGTGAGFFINNKDPGDNGFDFLVNDFLQGSQFSRHLHVADVLAASSAVVSKMYGFYLKVVPKGDHDAAWYKTNRMRTQYRLSDGGKSDNTGVLPLVERGVKLIVASQIAQDVHGLDENDPEKQGPKFGDLNILAEQVSTLFGVKIETAAIERQIVQENRLFASSCYVKECDFAEAGTILFIKPTYQNIESFMDWLREKYQSGPVDDRKLYHDVLTAIEEDEQEHREKKGGHTLCHTTRFPQNPTFCNEYDMDLVRAYYLLGRYVVVEGGLGAAILKRIGAPCS